jgi:endonuclease/exonuclease/phosphatase family metal-dependent hydrolase
LPTDDFFPHFNNQPGDLTIWKLVRAAPQRTETQVAVVHLTSKAGGAKNEDQQAVAAEFSREIAEYEDDQKCQDTILVGDLNMNPFEPGMVIVSGFHAAMTKQIAIRPARKWRRQKYRRFYNPMWGLFGDRTPGPAGTHYWKSSVPSNQHWHMFDQVLLRPSMIDRLRSIQILDHDGQERLLDGKDRATKDYLSDHLPILFDIDI